MNTRYEIPLTANPQRMTIAMAGSNYQLTVKWNDPSQVWVLDIADADGNAIVSGIPLITGADLLEQYGYLNFGGQIICETEGNLLLPPNFTNLGTTSHVYFEVT